MIPLDEGAAAGGTHNVLETWTERAAESSRQAKVRLDAVSKMYMSGQGKKAANVYAVKDISLSIFDGEFISFVGPSGCGKSTLINLIAGFERPDSGSILCEGGAVNSSGPDRLVIFQEQSLFPWLSVRKNIEFGLRIKGMSKEQRRERAAYFLNMVHLNKFADSLPFQLSGGMKQRVAIARALAVEPKMLLMDEPFSSLDHRTRDLLHMELQQIWLQTKKTIVFVTHSVEEALRLSDRIVIMSSQPGRIRRIIRVSLPRPRDFFDPAIIRLRTAILEDLEDELNKLALKEGDNDWKVEEGALRRRAHAGVDSPVGNSHTI